MARRPPHARWSATARPGLTYVTEDRGQDVWRVEPGLPQCPSKNVLLGCESGKFQLEKYNESENLEQNMDFEFHYCGKPGHFIVAAVAKCQGSRI